MSRRLTAIFVASVALAGAGRALYVARDEDAAAFRDELRRRVEAAPDENALPIGSRYFSNSELTTASAGSLIGRGALRAKGVAPPFDQPVPVIADFRDRLAERGVDLWVVPVPVRPWVAPGEVFDTRFPPSTYTEPYRAFVEALREEGVTTVDLLPGLQSSARDAPADFIHATDPHRTGKGVVSAAKLLGEKLRALPWFEVESPVAVEARWVKVQRDLSRGGIRVPEGPDETIRVRRVRRIDPTTEETSTLSVTDGKSPVVIIGDSHVSWYHDEEADVARQLTRETGLLFDTLPLAGGGATRVREELARRAWANPDYLPSKKLVIWVFWTEIVYAQAWHVVPLDPFDASRLQRIGQSARVQSDLHIVEAGRGLASFDNRWRVPDPSEDDGVAWIVKPESAGISFPAEIPDGASLVLELVCAHAPREVSLRFDDEPPVSLPALPVGISRVRLPLPPRPAGVHTLRMGIDESPRPVRALGVRSATLLRSAPVHSVDLAANAEAFLDLADKSETDIHVSGRYTRMLIPLPAPVERALLRVRLRSAGDELSARFRVNGVDVLVDQLIPPAWSEHAIALPAGVLVAGDNTLEVEADQDFRGRSLVWDVVEVDSVAP